MSEKKELMAVLQGNAFFCRNLYKILSEGSGNVFFSPISAHTVLSMVYVAARGATKEAFDSALSISDPDTVAKGYNLVMSYLNDTQDVQLHIANKIYLKDGHKLHMRFKESVQNQFLSEIEQVNFEENVKAANNINGWVEKKTNNKIKDLIESDTLDKDTRVVLVNAIYFKGDWLDKFDPNRTTAEKFYLNDVDTVDCQMMSRCAKYMLKVDQDLDAKVLELPYKNRNLSLIVILPNKRNGIADLEAKLLSTDLTKITDGMSTTEVNVNLPKFRIETTLNLKDPLTKLGLGVMFEDNADFSGMIDSREHLCVSEVIQKAFIEVNEEGAEAAAATEMIIMRCSRRSSQYFHACYPFIVCLHVCQEGISNILFKGRVCSPTPANKRNSMELDTNDNGTKRHRSKYFEFDEWMNEFRHRYSKNSFKA